MAFLATVRAAVAVIDDDPSALVTFGIKPTHPETGYGYIERGRSGRDPRRHPGPPRRAVSREARPRDGRAVPGRGQLRLELGDLRLARGHDPGRAQSSSPRARPGPRADRSGDRHGRRARDPGPAVSAARASADRQGRHGARSQRAGARGPVSMERRRRLARARRACSSAMRPATPSRATWSPATRPARS